MPCNLSDAPSLSVATLPHKAVVMGFGSKLIIGRYPLGDEATPSPHNSVLVDDGQIVRAVAFLHIPDGPLCVVSAGDKKFINVYNVSSWKQNNPNALQNSSDDDDDEGGMDTADILDDEARRKSKANAQPVTLKKHQLAKAEYWKPSYQYGPHTKRITSLATCSEGTIVFADKFGEVYRIRLSWSPSHTIEVDGDATKPATFLLQHFSTISTLYLTAPVPRIEPVAASEERSGVACRRLFTCDKDRHARVSRFPETYVVEQFLWTRNSVQSAVTCVAEISYVEDEAVYDSTYHHNAARVNKHNKSLNAPYSYYVTGTHAGDVHFWAAKNNVSIESDNETFHLIGTFRPRSPDGQPENFGPVVGVTVLTSVMDRFGHPLHPRDCPRGVLVAYEQCSDVFFVPIYDNVGAHSMHPAMVSASRTSLDARPVAMVGSNEATAFILKRNGHVSFMHLCIVAPPEKGMPTKTCSFNANIPAEVQELPVRMPFLEERIKAVMCGPAAVEEGAQTATGTDRLSELEALDLCASWRYEVVDPRTRRRDNNEVDGDDGSNESGGDEGEETGSAPKKGNGKRARVETERVH
ncbi:conserved hypothetical protein [Leishmania mexicana MHOM/GT/2001/U1103]|uniref:Uncharacterized protein n=1 Tax=Leishmania mexicana (strain MHOM/GT/2001/U1103) TaxID=929439 RepID=E9B3N7_LEIMU|nr:conserved hypothetical protein [Leishmania mexicana MHOM/GT/2001/U1103]CBZ29854.1 conserved hypothetical protein [Leishmania mexicana MHOM/GT/2001/U1103]